MTTQAEVEQRMYYGGIARAERSINGAEGRGQAHQNPYAKAIFRDYVLPVADAVKAQIAHTGAGRKQAHVALLSPLDPEAVAFLAVRTTLNMCLHTPSDIDHRKLGYQIGKSVHNELVLSQIEAAAPELYFTLARDLGRRLSKDERHRMTVMKMQAKDRGIDWVEWDIGARHQVGLYLLGLLQVAGMVEIPPEAVRVGKLLLPRPVILSDTVLHHMAQIKTFVAIASPVYGPCIETPLDWKDNSGGGFHTPEMRRQAPFLVQCHPSARHLYRGLSMPTVEAAANALQRTGWAINRKLMAAVKSVGAAFSTEEIVTLADIPRPAAPPWLGPQTDKAKLDPEQAVEFRAWKRRMAAWYTERKLRGVRYGRFGAALRMAEEFSEQPAIYFVYFADSRGRLYPRTYGVNPQGSDLQKALLKFAVGKPVDTPSAIRWFHVQGANKWGFDKASLADRHQWVIDRQDLILSFADDPVANRGWAEADSPLQFLAWCMEYAEWVRDTDGTFVSHLPISMDGSCNGLQNLSAMLRDEVGGRATNLTANTVMEDIYRKVAEAATVRMQAAVSDDGDMRRRWLEHGIARSVVKRSVMTTPYGVTQRTACEYVVEDYLKSGAAPCFEAHEYRAAAAYLMSFVWPAIGDVIVKGAQAMAWLKRAARCIIKKAEPDSDQVISWVSPSGFLATQAYFEEEVHRIRTRLFGEQSIRVLSESAKMSATKHSSGLAPNFVHSMDAAHLHRTAAAAAQQGVTALAMIHDDYGTHAADADTLFRVIRQEFVAMYEQHDPIADFSAKYQEVPAPPERGALDIREVLQSPYFFS